MSDETHFDRLLAGSVGALMLVIGAAIVAIVGLALTFVLNILRGWLSMQWVPFLSMVVFGGGGLIVVLYAIGWLLFYFDIAEID